MADVDEDEEFNPSKLGTKEYWDDFYRIEKHNFDDHGDVGEIWFGKRSLANVASWLKDNIPLDSRILDVGSGNGQTSLELRKKYGYKEIVGVDYSKDAVELAREISSRNHVSDLIFLVRDITTDRGFNSEDELLRHESFEVIIDKGTYDAISLCPVNARELRLRYIQNINYLLDSVKGVFIITSCNWTNSELENHFNEHFKSLHVIPTTTFTYGGKIGKNITSMIFKKK